MTETGWTLIVHGGAKEIAPDEEQAHRDGCIEAAEVGAAVLRKGGSAIDAVEASIRVLERLPTFNAGYGSALTSEGEVEMCAALMDGETLDVGAVGVIKGVRHPVSVARALLREEHVLLSGPGARVFAEEKGAELCDASSLIIKKQKEELQDTVGAVALDSEGNLAAGTSTGGLSNAHPGRMGDSPLPGCGYYAENGEGAVALSGHGEGLARLMAAGRIMAGLQVKSPENAVRATLEQMERVGGDAGGIALDANGCPGWWHNSPDFAVARIDSTMERPLVWLRKGEDIDAHG
jgi:beta-aspartyl-peptidase (threonine type)